MVQIVLKVVKVLAILFTVASQAHASTNKMSLRSARLVGLEQCQARLKTTETNVLAQIPIEICSKMKVGDELTDLELEIAPTVAPPEVEFSGDLHLVKVTSKTLGTLATGSVAMPMTAPISKPKFESP